MNKTFKIFALSTLTIGLTACSNKATPVFDYQSANNKIVNLEVPPDLYNPSQGHLYTLPDGTVANPNAMAQSTTQAQSSQRVLTKIENVRIERSSNQRWLVVDKKSASELWPILRAFWQEAGFTIATEEPRAGLMETDWAENRAKLPNQGLRRIFDKIGMGGVYTTSERDKFLIRIEHNTNDGLDIFFIHKGLEEVYTNKNEDTIVWKPRSNDPNLEAAMLARFMQYLGADEAAISQQLEQATKKQVPEFAKLEVDSLLVYGKAQRNVNRIGLALDRVGLTVQQYIPERGMFIVRPAPFELPAVQEESKPGLIKRVFHRLFGQWIDRFFNKQSSETNTVTTQASQLFIMLEETGEGQRVILLDQFGSPYQGKDAHIWLNELYKELR